MNSPLKNALVHTILFANSLWASSQSYYYNTYEEYIAGQRQPIDTVILDSRSKNRQKWWGGNDFTIATGDKATDKVLKKKAFAVVHNDTTYINCRNLRHDKIPFGNGYVQARRIGERSLLFVNRMCDKETNIKASTMGFMFGAIGGAVMASQIEKQQVCYVISQGTDFKDNINVLLLDDNLIEKILKGQETLLDEYYAEKKITKRRLAKHIIPILEKAGYL